MEKFKKRWTQSIQLRIGCAMGVIAALALASIVASTVFTELSTGKASAINLAGSLRMQSYALSTVATSTQIAPADRAHAVGEAMREFEHRLGNPLLTSALGDEASGESRRAYSAISQRWEQEIAPAFRRAAQGEAGAALLDDVHAFVAEIDHFVRLLEGDLEGRIRALRLMQGAALFLIVIAIITALYLLHDQIVEPLAQLLRAARTVTAGNFGVRVANTGEDELGILGQAFNRMTEELSKSYAALESRVEEKTAELARSNRSLDVLYRTTKLISQTEVTREALEEVLRQLEASIGANAGLVCTRAPEPVRSIGRVRVHGFVAAEADGTAHGMSAHVCRETDCARCYSHDSVTGESVDTLPGTRNLFVPLVDRGLSFGVMVLRIPDDTTVEPWQMQLLETAGTNIGAALASAHRREDHHRIALLEERSAIARELHDSLAQSLSYLKIQIARLMPQLAGNAEAGGIVEEIRTGLNAAYRQLRELLTTFRMGMHDKGLRQALEETVAEFRSREGLPIRLHYALSGTELAANEEVHVVQIVREALANVVHHAHATAADVTLERARDGAIDVTIDDDGVGLGAATAKRHHFGLAIMRDRAESLGGAFELAARPGGGTRARLRFAPKSPFQERGDKTPSAAVPA